MIKIIKEHKKSIAAIMLAIAPVILVLYIILNELFVIPLLGVFAESMPLYIISFILSKKAISEEKGIIRYIALIFSLIPVILIIYLYLKSI